MRTGWSCRSAAESSSRSSISMCRTRTLRFRRELLCDFVSQYYLEKAKPTTHPEVPSAEDAPVEPRAPREVLLPAAPEDASCSSGRSACGLLYRRSLRDRAFDDRFGIAIGRGFEDRAAPQVARSNAEYALEQIPQAAAAATARARSRRCRRSCISTSFRTGSSATTSPTPRARTRSRRAWSSSTARPTRISTVAIRSGRSRARTTSP